MLKNKMTLTQRVQLLETRMSQYEGKPKTYARTSGSNMIECIKAIREHNGCSLLEAKNLTEFLKERGFLK